jgi:hypothetical protein
VRSPPPPPRTEEQKKKLKLSDPKGEIHSFPLRLRGYLRGEKPGVTILAPKHP